jgi:acyl-coenzyme A synthetase/AMP-(fatty) acid ligase
MSAVFECAAARVLPLLAGADPARTVAWRRGRAVDARAFLGDVATVAAALPAGRGAINLCEDRYAFLVAFCAVLARGQTNLLPPSRVPQAVDEALAAYPGSYALSDVARQPAPPRCVLLPPLAAAAAAAGDVPELEPAHVAAIGFTSGSTGAPKANPKSWRAFHASATLNAAAIAATLGLPAGALAHVVATVPSQHMYGIELSVLLPLLGPFAVSDRHPLFPADVAAALAELPAPRVLVTTPVHLRALLRDPTPLPPLGAITSATAPLPPELAAAAEARYGAPVLELFGSTETCVIAQRRTAHEEDWRLYPDVTLRPQPDGTVVDTPYFEQPVLLPDVVELLPGHRFALRGRQADLVEIAGKRASLADLTRRVLALSGVEDAAVFQTDEADAFGVRRIAALVVAPRRSEGELLADLRDAVDAAFLPRPLRKVTALPRNATGKLPRAALLAALQGAA